MANNSFFQTTLQTPNSYSNNNGLICSWQIQVKIFFCLWNRILFNLILQFPQQSTIAINRIRTNVTYPKLAFLNFLNLTTSCDISNYNKTCGSEWVEVRSVSNQLDLGGPRYCCTSIPNEIVSNRNETIVLFFSSVQPTQSKGEFAGKTFF